MSNTNLEFVSTEVDLDRDVPYGEIEWDGSGVNADGWEGWNVNDRIDENGEILLTINPNNTEHFDVDVDEDGPFITASLDDPENWSTEKLDKWMDDYCEKHPDFNDAMNGLF